VVVIAGHQHDLGRRGGARVPIRPGAPRERGAESLEERPRVRERVAQRPLAQLDGVAEQDDPLDPVERLEQRRAQLLAPQQVVARASAEVEIGDDERGSQGARARQRAGIRRTAPPSPGGSASGA
jgi:hypothetical protein